MADFPMGCMLKWRGSHVGAGERANDKRHVYTVFVVLNSHAKTKSRTVTGFLTRSNCLRF